MKTCKRCGKSVNWTDKHGHCERCHNELFIARMKEMAGDTSADVGLLVKRVGLFNRYACRLCGKLVSYKDVKTELDKRTGYCFECTEKLKAAYRQKEAEAVQKAAEPQPEIITIKLSGTSFLQDVLLDFAEPDPEYSMTQREIIEDGREDDPIYQYFVPTMTAELRPEPENEVDQDAIAVYAEGEHIGYIPKGQTKAVRDLLDAGRVMHINADVYGGPFKILRELDDGNYEMAKVNDNNFGVKVYIKASPTP